MSIVLASAITFGVSAGATSASSKAAPSVSAGTIVVGSPECAHCLAMSLLTVSGYKVEYEPFGSLTALTAAMASGAVQVGQADYTGLVSFLSKGLPMVAISGEVNGGSDFVLSPKINLAPNNWTGLRNLVLKDKAAGHLFTIASNFGSVQDIELRLELPKYGINPNTDVDIVNVEYPGMAAALHNGSAQAAVPVQPFAESILMDGYGKHFAYPYNQAAGNLTNVVVVTQSFLAAHPAEVKAIDKGMETLVSYLKTAAGVKAWSAAVEKYDNVGPAVVKVALAQLTPDLGIPFSQVRAFATAMYDQHLIASPLSTATLQARIDYSLLAKATGLSVAGLGGGS